MQDRYAGDIGDFGKFALLRVLNDQGLSIGVNWYKTCPLDSERNIDGSYKQDDGKYINFTDEIIACDPFLAKEMMRISKLRDHRSLQALEEARLVPNALFYNTSVPVDDRERWHKNAVQYFQLQHVNLVFLDPDNGLLVKSVNKHSKRSVKYAFYEEALDYIEQGMSVLIYNHRSRKPELKYFIDIEKNLHDEISKRKLKNDTEILEISFPRYSIRDYIAISACPEHAKKIRTAFDVMLSGEWGKAQMCWKPLTMDITYSEYRARFSKNTSKKFLKYYQALPEEMMRAMVGRDKANTAIKACAVSIWYKK